MMENQDENKASPTLSQQAVELVQMGFRRADAARALGASPQLVTLACQRAGIPNERNMKRGDVVKARAAAREAARYRKAHGLPDPGVIVADRLAGLKFKEIAAKHGLRVSQVRGVWGRHQKGGYRYA